jgi:hypothetical protein
MWSGQDYAMSGKLRRITFGVLTSLYEQGFVRVCNCVVGAVHEEHWDNKKKSCCKREAILWKVMGYGSSSVS